MFPKKFLQQYNIKPSKRLGQNFLIDKSVLRKIIQAANLSKDDIVLEIGPGLGILTLELAKCVKKVIAVEKDKRMVQIVKNVLNDRGVKNVEIVEGDILKLALPNCHSRPASVIPAKAGIQCGVNPVVSPSNPSSGNPEENKTGSRIKRGMTSGDYKIIANIPYYLTSPLIRKFLEMKNQPKFMLLMVQKEVAQRICAKPPKITLLSVATQFYAEPKIISYVSKKSFWPQPKVDSAIIKIAPRPHPSVIARRSIATTKQSHGYAMGLPRDLRSLAMTIEFRDHFFRVVKAGFSQPRKQLINNLSKGLNLSREKTQKILLKADISPTQRPGELSVDKYRELAWIIWGK